MFAKASSFNQDLNWDKSKVINMSTMFYRATSFNQNLNSWNVNSVADMELMFKFSALSTDNYDAILIGWSDQDVQPNVFLNAGDVKYFNSEDARQHLIGTYGCDITDVG